MSLFLTEVIDEEWGNYFDLTSAGYGMFILLLAICLIIGSIVFRPKKEKKAFSVKALAFSAVAMALAMVTSNIKLYHMPMGGSITLFSMLFICLVGYWYGLRTGLTVAVAYGLLQLVMGPYIISIPQLLCDYPLAFGALGLSGVFAGKKHGLIAGYLLGVLGRYFFAFLSGYIFFGEYASYYNMNAVTYSLVYNGAYIWGEALITVIILCLPPVRKAFAKVKELATA